MSWYVVFIQFPLGIIGGAKTHSPIHKGPAQPARYGENINKIRVKLTPREMEVCNLVKNGHSNKDIAGLLSIAQHTVEKHRRMARKKLGLTNQQINLHSYLNSL